MKKATPRKRASAQSRTVSTSPSLNQAVLAQFSHLKKTFNTKMDHAIKNVKKQNMSDRAVKSIEPVVLSALHLVKDLMAATVSIIPVRNVQRSTASSRR